jgi:hypothetical protein
MFRKHGAIPVFLQGMLSLIFDRETGRINDENEFSAQDFPTLIASVRQISLAFKKVRIDCTPSRVAAALTRFIDIERDFKSFNVTEADHAEFSAVSAVLWDNMLVDFQPSTSVPSHGPGATADRISGNRKYNWRIWHERLEPYFPILDYGYPVSIHDHSEFDSVTLVPADCEQPVRVVTVPKTLKSPRIIAIEPCCMQYAQHGIQAFLTDRIESYWLTTGHVNFTDQSINQSLAMSSSISGQLATIDLSDASDRVPRDLALEMFRSNPDLQDSIDACRSTHAEMPDGTIIGPLNKFASMGSALCFPVEAMYFYTICVASLLKIRNLPVTQANVFNVSRDVHVYGDDIVVPATYAIAVLDYLQKYNCKVNIHKTFVKGNFRESCGVDAYRGVQVTPVYLTMQRPKNRQQASELISWCSVANSFTRKNYWHTSQLMFSIIERILGPLPFVSDTSQALGRTSLFGYDCNRHQKRRFNQKFQRLEVKAWIPQPVYRTDKLGGYGALQKSFLSLQGLKNLDSPRDALHLERSALYGAVVIKRRWVPTS